MYTIKYHEKAVKSLKKINQILSSRIIKNLEKFSQNPTKYGKSLSGNKKGYWRYRVGDYRIICEIRKKELLILVVDIGHRGSVYKN